LFPTVSADSIRAVLLEAGAIAQRHFARGSAAVSLKPDATPVTPLDREISVLLRQRLAQLVQHAAWLGEEEHQPGAAAQAELLWIVDPLDGTKEFIRGIPEFAISAALVARGTPVAGGVVNPITAECGTWSTNDGLTLTHAAAQHAAPGLSAAVASVSRTEHEKGSLRAFSRVLRDLRPLGSVAYKLLRLAALREDLYFSVEPKSTWDICAGIALLRARGFEYRRFDGVSLVFGEGDTRVRSGAVAGPPRLLDEFLKRFESEIARHQKLIVSGTIT
jgi:myo-inositol-1(or 4)-monophosphatase